MGKPEGAGGGSVAQPAPAAQERAPDTTGAEVQALEHVSSGVQMTATDSDFISHRGPSKHGHVRGLAGPPGDSRVWELFHRPSPQLRKAPGVRFPPGADAIVSVLTSTGRSPAVPS